MPQLLKLAIPSWELALRSVVVYVVLLAALRLFGKREVGQFTVYDLVLVLLVANAVQPAMTGPDSSLTGGVIIIATLILLNFVVGRLDGLAWFHRLVSAEPTLIVRNGRYNNAELRRQGVSREEFETALREHGLDKVSDVAVSYLEPDGTISIVPKDAGGLVRVRRRVRYRRQN